jgi:cytoskeleton protein RodZ
VARIGEKLTDARLAKGRSIADAARSTKIRAKYLEALEADDYDTIPGDAYGRGFLRNYAEYLDLDASEILRQHRLEHPRPMIAGIPEPLDHLDRDQTQLPRRVLVIGGVVLVLALIVWIAVGLIGLATGGRQGAKPAKEATQTPAAATGAVVRTGPRKETVIELSPKGVGLPYVEVSTNGRIAWEGLLGQPKVFRGKKVRVRTAHPEQVRIVQDKKPVKIGAGPGTAYDQVFLGR